MHASALAAMAVSVSERQNSHCSVGECGERIFTTGKIFWTPKSWFGEWVSSVAVSVDGCLCPTFLPPAPLSPASDCQIRSSGHCEIFEVTCRLFPKAHVCLLPLLFFVPRVQGRGCPKFMKPAVPMNTRMTAILMQIRLTAHRTARPGLETFPMPPFGQRSKTVRPPTPSRHLPILATAENTVL